MYSDYLSLKVLMNEVADLITVPSLIVQQGKHSFYTFVLSVAQLAEICYVARRKEGVTTNASYQRLLDTKRATAISKYIEAGGTLPTNIIVNFNSKQQIIYNDKSNTLTFPKVADSAWIIDGQHRFYGAMLLIESLTTHIVGSSYQFLVAAFVGLDSIQQARIFIDINSHQQGVSKSLLYDLMNLFESENDNQEEYYFARASDIVKRFGTDPESPFFERISFILDRKQGKISQAAFVDALVPLIRKGGVLSHSNQYEFTLEEQYTVLRNYFVGVQYNLKPHWFNNTSILTKTTGFNALMLSFADIFKYTVSNFEGFTVENAKKVLAPLQKVPWTSKELKGQQGTIASKNLSELVVKAVKNSDQQGNEKGKIRLKI
jgi:DGQHR domain-containing protein